MTPEPTTADSLWDLFHNLWSRDVGTPGYDKAKWLKLEAIIGSACNGTGRKPDPTAAGRAKAVWDALEIVYGPEDGFSGEQRDIAALAAAIREAEAAAFRRGAEAMRAALAAQLRSVADQYEKDGEPGELGYNCWGWRGIAKTFRDEAAAIAALPVPEDRP